MISFIHDEKIDPSLRKISKASTMAASADTKADRKKELLSMFNEKAPVSKTLGMVLSFDDNDSAVITRPYTPALNTSYGVIHGGVASTMCDTAMWFAAAIHYDPKTFLVTSGKSVLASEKIQINYF